MCAVGLEENIHTQEFTSVMREEFTTVEGKGGKGKLPLSLQLCDQKHGPAIRPSSMGWCGQGFYRIDGFYRDLHCLICCSVSLPGSSLSWSYL